MYLLYLLYLEVIPLLLKTNIRRNYLNECVTSTLFLIRSVSFIAYYSGTTLLSSVIARGWLEWWSDTHSSTLISICKRTRGESRMKSMWVKARTGRPFGSYHYGQNKIKLEKINLIWSKLKYVWIVRNKSKANISFYFPMFSQSLLLHCWLLSEKKKQSHFLSPLFLCLVSCRQCKERERS